MTHGEINLGYQNRQDTNPEYTVPGNTMNARTSVVTGPLRDVRKKFTSKNDYTYAPNPAYGVASTMNKDSIHTMKTDLEKILSMRIADGSVPEALTKTRLGNDITYQEAILLAQVMKALNGDTQAAVFVRDSSGNKPKDAAVFTKTKKFEDL